MAAKAGAKQSLKPKKGQKRVTFTKGGLHTSLGVPQGQKIPAAKMSAALSGKAGPKAKAQAVMATGMLAKGRRTAAKKSTSTKKGSS